MATSAATNASFTDWMTTTMQDYQSIFILLGCISIVLAAMMMDDLGARGTAKSNDLKRNGNCTILPSIPEEEEAIFEIKVQ